MKYIFISINILYVYISYRFIYIISLQIREGGGYNVYIRVNDTRNE